MQLDPSTLLRIKGSCRPMKGIAINSSLCKYPAVRKCATTSGWEEADEKSDDWQIFWTDLSVSHQRVKALQQLQRLQQPSHQHHQGRQCELRHRLHAHLLNTQSQQRDLGHGTRTG